MGDAVVLLCKSAVDEGWLSSSFADLDRSPHKFFPAAFVFSDDPEFMYNYALQLPSFQVYNHAQILDPERIGPFCDETTVEETERHCFKINQSRLLPSGSNGNGNGNNSSSSSSSIYYPPSGADSYPIMRPRRGRRRKAHEAFGTADTVLEHGSVIMPSSSLVSAAAAAAAVSGLSNNDDNGSAIPPPPTISSIQPQQVESLEECLQTLATSSAVRKMVGEELCTSTPFNSILDMLHAAYYAE